MLWQLLRKYEKVMSKQNLTKMSPERILIINIFGIGDVLFTTPLLQNIKKNFPESVVGYLCNKRALSVLENNPLIDKLFIYEKDDYRNLFRISKVQFFKKIVSSLKELKEQDFDVVIDLSLNKYANFFMWLIGIKTRIGLNYKNRSSLLTHKTNIKGFEDKHVVMHYLSVLEHSGCDLSEGKLEVFIKDDDAAFVDGLLKDNNISSNNLIVGLIPGGGASWGPDAKYRRWNPERHAQLADKIIDKYGAKIVLMGDESELELGRQVVDTMKNEAIQLTGKTTIGQYLALLSRCNLVVMNDGGPLHMAVAAGAKTVSLIGPVDEHVYGPYPLKDHYVVTADIACRPCYRNFRRADCDHIGCLGRIEVDDVFEKVEEALK